jgi:hypothetical protein
MTFKVWSTGAGLFLVAVGVVAGATSGQAAGAATRAFKTSSGNNVCEGWSKRDGSGEIVCVIKTGLKLPAVKQDCSGGGDPIWNRVRLSPIDNAEPVLCAGDPGPLAFEPRARTLVQGATWVQGDIACAAFSFGLVCSNKAGHGFFLSRDQSRLF